MLRPSLIVLLALLATGCGSRPDQRNLDNSLAKFIPEDTIALAGVRMQEIQDSPVYRKLSARMPLPQADAFSAQTGFDPRRDVKDLLVAHNGKAPLLIARGVFHPRIPDTTPKTEYKSYTIYGDAHTALVLVDAATALAGATSQVQAAIDQFKSGGTAASALVARARALPGHSQAWAVGDNRLVMLVPSAGNLANLGRFAGPLEDLTVLADLGEGLHATATGNFKTEEDAKNLGVAARGILGLARLSMPENQPDLARLYDTISLEQRQRTIKLEATIPVDLIDKLAALLGR